MPRSDYEGKDQIRKWISDVTPKHKKILDIAVGEGTYLNLFKNLENLQGCEWYGVEIWEPWVPKYKLDEIYDYNGLFSYIFDHFQYSIYK